MGKKGKQKKKLKVSEKKGKNPILWVLVIFLLTVVAVLVLGNFFL